MGMYSIARLPARKATRPTTPPKTARKVVTAASEDPPENAPAAVEDEEEGEEVEPWHEWTQRVTRMALEQMRKAQVDDWAAAARRKIWSLAGHISRRSDGRWSTVMLDWIPRGDRRAGHPAKRWRDDIEKVSSIFLEEEGAGEWRIAAESHEDWKGLEED